VPKKRKGRKRCRTRNPDSIKASKRKFAKHRFWAGHYMTAGNCKKGPMTLFRFGTCNVCMPILRQETKFVVGTPQHVQL
jgi:hypothetical protein